MVKSLLHRVVRATRGFVFPPLGARETNLNGQADEELQEFTAETNLIADALMVWRSGDA